ncbi:phosphoglycerate mutase [Hamiltosporidium tvaerminnensis]|uniref:phosphoglycerate mutase (2,3-diphosphoglycerate-independent) n=1 Tax=Hamiltosporidium tvaerminnensis TaxID=1176355 RepID=A0A4Q9LB28_9MICR|nr:hypothetical protein LUQ84_000882 [Hamiltosporidium tvaerminnensis]TBU04231.1 phosphoglycerate mutase [Hamiltosporidium tvaerminnensis]TBU11865.1 phosphoglycerate mutase [Hamiltosporidium tvaerminnensis]
MKKVCLIVIDGWGINRKKVKYDAIRAACCTNMKRLSTIYPSFLLKAHGKDVGLPKNMMGNSEVGHLTIGSGRIINQDIVRINKSIKTREIKQKLSPIIEDTNTLHLIGLLSDGGVHSHISHLKSILKCLKNSNRKVYIHMIADGRDTSPTSFLKYYDDIKHFIKKIKTGSLVSVIGRSYAMDRDGDYSKTDIAIENMVSGANVSKSFKYEIKKMYAKGITDEHLLPVFVEEDGRIKPEDSIFFFNFRPDRMRQIVSRFISRQNKVYTMTHYFDSIATVIFDIEYQKKTLAEVISDKNLNQTHISESEKYAHVTYFFNGKREEPFPKENRIHIKSPPGPFDKCPSMSLNQVTESVINEIKNGTDFVMANFAPPDMVGHTGSYEATIEAVKATDEAIGHVYNLCRKKGYVLVITADHGNAEIMKDEDDEIVKKHTKNKVPFIICQGEGTGKYKDLGHSLVDVSPTILNIMNLDVPKEMTGRNVLNDYENNKK